MTQGHSITVTPADLHVEVSVNGVKVAESDHPVLLEETGLPTRYYLPASTSAPICSAPRTARRSARSRARRRTGPSSSTTRSTTTSCGATSRRSAGRRASPACSASTTSASTSSSTARRWPARRRRTRGSAESSCRRLRVDRPSSTSTTSCRSPCVSRTRRRSAGATARRARRARAARACASAAAWWRSRPRTARRTSCWRVFTSQKTSVAAPGRPGRARRHGTRQLRSSTSYPARSYHRATASSPAIRVAPGVDRRRGLEPGTATGPCRPAPRC